MGRARARRSSASSTPKPPSRPTAGRRVLAAGVALAALAAGAAWLWRAPGALAPPAAAPPASPNILLVTLDTTRADRLGSYGYAAAATPHLDRLARDGVRFERALSTAPLTLPAHASLLTGRQPFTHGVRNNGHFVLPDDVPTLATALASRGYETAAFVSSFVLDRQFGLARGFGRYDDGLDEVPPGPFVSLELERRGDRTRAAVQEWLRARGRHDGARPYLLWVHLYDAHEPYAPPSPFRESFASRPYDGEIAFQDAVVGQLLADVGYASMRSPLVLVAGDHGESLGEHGESTHGLFVYDAALRVPLIVAWPGVLAPRVVGSTVSLVDVAPTLLDLAGAPSIEGADGRSLRALLEGGKPEHDPAPAYAETYFPQFFMQWAPLRAIHAGRWKYIDAPEPELYDLEADPREERNLLSHESTRATSLKRALDGMETATGGRLASTTLTPDVREKLASLGYVSAAAPAPAPAATSLPDPKNMAPLFERLLDGNRALAQGDATRAARIAREALAQDNGNAFARLLLGRASLAAGRDSDAIAAFRAYVTSVPGSADAHHWMALAHLRLGDRPQALKEEEAALALDPRHTAALALKAGLLFSGGRREDGLHVLREAVDRRPDDASLRVELADLLTDAKRFEEAEAEYRRVLDRRPHDSRALLGMGLVLGATNRPEAAMDPLTRAVEADPANDEARFARAEVLERLGRPTEARSDYAWVATESSRSDLRRVAAEKLASLPGR
jgi:arylsulfatase A-like enzyme/Flp pilus assembly protein TadD